MSLSLRQRQLHNSSTSIHRLPHELISEIFWGLWCDADDVATRERARDVLGSVCSLWRFLVVTDPRFWTLIHLADASGLPISPSDEERVETCLARSGTLPLQLSMDFTQGAVERTPSLKRCLDLLKAPEQLGRCESIHVLTTSGAGWEQAFPLRGEMPVLKELRVQSHLQWNVAFDASEADGDVWTKEPVTFFANTPPALERLVLDVEHPHPYPHSRHWHPRQAGSPDAEEASDLLAYIDPRALRFLSLRAHIPHQRAFSFIHSCTSLDSLELELRAEDAEDTALEAFEHEDDDDSDSETGVEMPIHAPKQDPHFINGIHCPSLRSLKLLGPSATMLSAIINAPSLSKLHYTIRDEEETFALSYALLAASLGGDSAGGEDSGELEGLERLVIDSEPVDRQSLDAADLDALHRRTRSGSTGKLYGPDPELLDGHLYPNIRELSITGDYSLCAPSDAIAAFVSASTAHRQLEVLRLTTFANTAEVLELLGGDTDLNVSDDESSSSSSAPSDYVPSSPSSSSFSEPSSPSLASTILSSSDSSLPSSLHSLVLIDSPSGNQLYPPVSDIAAPLAPLLKSNEHLKVTWVRPGDWTDADVPSSRNGLDRHGLCAEMHHGAEYEHRVVEINSLAENQNEF